MIRKMAVMAAIMSLLLVSAAFAQHEGMGQMADKPKLTDQQREQMEKLQIQFQRDQIKLQSDLKLARLDLKEIMMKDPIQERAAISKQERISAIRGEIAKLRLQHRIEMIKIAGPEMRKEFMQMHRGMRRGMGGRGMGMRGGCCGGPGGPMIGEGMMGGPGMMMERREIIKKEIPEDQEQSK